MRRLAARKSTGGHLKAIHSYALLAATAFMLNGCSGLSGPPKPVAVQSSSVSASSQSTVSKATTCLTLFGKDSNHLATDSVQFLVDVESLNAETAKTAKSFGTRLGEVAAMAEPELAAPLQVMKATFEGFNQAWLDSSGWELDTKSFTAAKDTIAKICGVELDALDGVQPTSQASTPPSLPVDEETFLASVQAAHPAMRSSDTARMISVGRNFCSIHAKGVENGQESATTKLVQDLITASAGIEYTFEELQTIHRAAVRTFCPEHIDKID